MGTQDLGLTDASAYYQQQTERTRDNAGEQQEYAFTKHLAEQMDLDRIDFVHHARCLDIYSRVKHGVIISIYDSMFLADMINKQKQRMKQPTVREFNDKLVNGTGKRLENEKLLKEVALIKETAALAQQEQQLIKEIKAREKLRKADLSQVKSDIQGRIQQLKSIAETLPAIPLETHYMPGSIIEKGGKKYKLVNKEWVQQ